MKILLTIDRSIYHLPPYGSRKGGEPSGHCITGLKHLLYNIDRKSSSFGQVERFPFIIEPWNVVLINDDWHSLDDVIMQLIKATGCSVKKATDLVWEAEQRGEAVCYCGPKNHCEVIGAVLDEIELRFRLERMT